MSVAWEVLNPAVLSLVESIAVDANGGTLTAEHKDRARKLLSTQQKRALTLQILNVIGLGDDEERSEDVASGATGADAPWAGKLRRSVVGHRKVTYRLVCDALENTDKAWAWGTIERVRTRLRRTTSLDALARVDAALNSVGQSLEANFRHDKRIVNRVLLDFALNVRVNDVEEAPIGWIEHVVLTSEVHDVDGALLPTPPNVDDLEIPPIP